MTVNNFVVRKTGKIAAVAHTSVTKPHCFQARTDRGSGGGNL